MTIRVRIENGESAQEVIIDLVREAMTAAEGRVPDPRRIAAQIEQAAIQARTYARAGEDQKRLHAELLREIRICLLDPRRPAQDLLDDLVAGIHGCWLMYAEASDLDYDDAHLQFERALREAATATLPD